MKGKKLVSIVIVSWNALGELRCCLDSILKSSISDYEIIVVDNNSADGTPECLQEFYPMVRVHRNTQNLGHTKSINVGLMLAAGRFCLILDCDTELERNCLETLVSFLESNADVMMVAPRTFNSDGTVQESARNFPGPLSGLFGRQSILTRIFPNNRFSARYLARSLTNPTNPFQVQQIGGACMFFRRELLERIGMWDERYFGYWVDTDWCRSAYRCAQLIFCVPTAKIIHHEGNARGKPKNWSRIWMFHYGAYLYYTKWYCRGRGDPRSIFAALALLTRALLLMVANAVIRTTSSPVQKKLMVGSVVTAQRSDNENRKSPSVAPGVAREK